MNDRVEIEPGVEEKRRAAKMLGILEWFCEFESFEERLWAAVLAHPEPQK